MANIQPTSESGSLIGGAVFVSPAASRGDLEKRLLALTIMWKVGRGPSSSLHDMVLHPAYQQIIGMGPAVLPLLFGELKRESDYWFAALSAITGENPILDEHRGSLDKMTEDWLAWGKAHGFV